MQDKETLNKFFRFKCYKHLKEKNLNKPEYISRLDYELDTIEKMGFSAYFLIVCDFLRWARDHNILTGPGRGSVAGSLIAFLLDITQIDPIKYGLLFERFLNPGRLGAPLISVTDLSYQEFKDKILSNVEVKQIITD